MNREVQEFDARIGARLRQLRIESALTQQEFARRLKVTYQQLVKYEHGVNRLAASRLWCCAQILGVEINAFFEGIENQSIEPASDERATLFFLKSVAHLSPAHQKAVTEVVRALTSTGEAA